MAHWSVKKGTTSREKLNLSVYFLISQSVTVVTSESNVHGSAIENINKYGQRSLETSSNVSNWEGIFKTVYEKGLAATLLYGPAHVALDIYG